MLNRTPGTAPSAEDLAAEDRRIEVAAARETALAMALRYSPYGGDAIMVLASAVDYENFMLAHQANGQVALESALQFFRGLSPTAENLIETATRFSRYLDSDNAFYGDETDPTATMLGAVPHVIA